MMTKKMEQNIAKHNFDILTLALKVSIYRLVMIT